MPPNKYSHIFRSQNADDQHFTLTFEVMPAKHLHFVADPQVYQQRGDVFCKVAMHTCNNRCSLRVESIIDMFKFSIDIYVRPEGCEIFVVEQVLTTIAHTQLRPLI